MKRSCLYWLLDQKNVLDLKDSSGSTLLMKAVINDNDKVVELLIQGGANCRAANKDGWTPLHFNAKYGSTRQSQRKARNTLQTAIASKRFQVLSFSCVRSGKELLKVKKPDRRYTYFLRHSREVRTFCHHSSQEWCSSRRSKQWRYESFAVQCAAWMFRDHKATFGI